MSFFSDLATSALGALTNGTATNGQNALSHVLTDLIANHSSGNGLAGLVEQLAASGLGPQVASWVGGGPNQPVSADQIHQALGPDKIAQLAQQVGLPPGQLTEALAHLLPQVIDRLTPQGQVPSGSAAPSAGLGSLLQSDWLRGLVGGTPQGS